jgi:integrase
MGRIFKRGKVWYLDFVCRGRRIKRSTKQRDKKLADLALKSLEVKVAKGELLGIEDRLRILFKECGEKYLAFSRANKARSSYERDGVSVRVHLPPAFKDRYLHELTRELIERYKAQRLQRVSKSRVNRELMCLRHMLNKAIEWGYLTSSPMKGIRLLKEPPERVRYLDPKEALKLLGACAAHLKPIIVCALHTGMRRGEILNLKWENVDLENRMILLERTKSNRRRMIPLSGVLCSVLKRLPRRGEYVFTNEQGDKYGTVNKSFTAACRRAGIKNFRFHDLRHTFASHLTMSGCNMRTVQQLLGHATIRTTMKYSHLSKEHLEEAVNVIGAKFSPQLGPNMDQSEVPSSETQWWA